MNSSFDMYRTPKQDSQYWHEQQMPSTSYSGGYGVPPGSPSPYGNQAAAYYHSNYGMRVPYPQNQSSAADCMVPAGPNPNFVARQQLDRKMMNTHEWVKNHRFMNVAQEHCRPGTASPSVISNFTHMSAVTGGSISSLQSLMSDVKRLQQLQISQPAAPSSSSSCVENIDPVYEQTATSCLDNICNVVQESIDDNDKGSLQSAANSLFFVAKNNYFNASSEYSLEALMRKLVDFIRRMDPMGIDADMSAIMEMLLFSISKMLSLDKMRKLTDKWDVESLLCVFLPWMVNTEKISAYALTTISCLMELIGPKIVSRKIREMIIIKLVEIIASMQQNSYNYFINTSRIKQYMFLLLRRAFRNDEALKFLFVSKDGMKLLLQLLSRESDHVTLSSIMRVLHALVSTPNIAFGLEFGRCKGLETVLYFSMHREPPVVHDALLALRAVSDMEEIRSSNNEKPIEYVVFIMDRFYRSVFDFDKNVIVTSHVTNFGVAATIWSLAVQFLANITASGVGLKNQNKDFIVERGAVIPRLIILLRLCRQARFKWKHVNEVETLVVNVIWALKVFTGSCSIKERTVKASTDLLKIYDSPELLLQELAGTTNLSCRLDILIILIRVVDADPLNHPQRLRNISIAANNTSLSFASVLFDIIFTTRNLKDPSSELLRKDIITKAYSLLLLLANSNLSFGNEIRCICGNYSMAEFLWSVVDDADLVKCALDFVTFVAAEETFRDYFSKDLNLISAVRHLAEQVNENASTAQSLLLNLTCETTIPFGSMTLL